MPLENQINLKNLSSYLIVILILIFGCTEQPNEKNKKLKVEKNISFAKIEFSEIYSSSNFTTLEKWNSYSELSEYIKQFNINDYSSLIDNKKYIQSFFIELKKTTPEDISKPEISSRLTVIETDFLRFESKLSNFPLSNQEKIEMVKKINNSFSNLNFQIDKLIEKASITQP